MNAEREQSIIFRYLSDSVASVKGGTGAVKVDRPEAFHSKNAAGELREVTNVEEARDLGKGAVARMRKLRF